MLITSNETQKQTRKTKGNEIELLVIVFISQEKREGGYSFEFSVFVFLASPQPPKPHVREVKGKKQVYQWNWGVITFQTLFISSGHPHECFGVTFGGFLEAFSVRVLTETFENGANCAGKPLFPFELLGRCGIQSKQGRLCWNTAECEKKLFFRWFSQTRKINVPGHPRPFGSGIGLSTPSAEMAVSGVNTPEVERKGGLLLLDSVGLWKSLFSFLLRFGRNSFMASSLVAPPSWSEIFWGSLESWRLWRLAERRVEWDLESKLW